MSTWPAGLILICTLGLRKSVALDQLLDDPALLVERLEVVVDRGLDVLELEAPRQAAAPAAEVDLRVAEPAHALRSASRSRAPRELAQRPLELPPVGRLEALRVRHVLLEEDAPASLLRPQPRELGVRAEERDPEPHGKLDLGRRGAKGA